MTDKTLDRLADYSDDSLLNELRRVATKLQKDTLSISDIETHARCSYAIIKIRFGGLRRALSCAELYKGAVYSKRTSESELLEELSRIWDEVLAREGRRPFKTDLKKYRSKYSERPFYRVWGSWIKACEAALEWDGRADSKVVTPSEGESNVSDSGRAKGNTKRSIPLSLRYKVLKRDNFTCISCGRSPVTHPGTALHVDHVIPESKGGSLDSSNLRCLCEECNLGKGNRDS
jgi:hypothetical protein